MTAREYVGFPIKQQQQPQNIVNLHKKAHEKPREWNEDYYLYSLKGMFKDNLNEYLGKGLERPNKSDLTNGEEGLLNEWKEEKEDREEHDRELYHEQRAASFEHFEFPKRHTHERLLCENEMLKLRMEDFYLLPLKKMFHTKYDWAQFERTQMQELSLEREFQDIQKKFEVSSLQCQPILERMASARALNSMAQFAEHNRQMNREHKENFPILVSDMEPLQPVNDPKIRRPTLRNFNQAPMERQDLVFNIEVAPTKTKTWIWKQGELSEKPAI
ncbi:hypothetical protein DLAC_04326 [Tieghemostelium lacteum]|uniref:Uncharacterized protein n=1 Tax=Tieghemostelium lacteum TaxID=361077 RepID=A0A151ZJ95_TIELA|nr:hypothetical protein DLAC_04326 [Tieghemostelium lacteum]|eukprot:KYQ94053.1 hypothetical protein DLAC_04326 [Tieghemostelium lacteum]